MKWGIAQAFFVARSAAPRPTYTCGICGFVMNEAGECPRCKLAGQEFQRLMEDQNSPGIFDQVRDLLDDGE